MFRRRGGLERGVGGREGGWGLCDWGSCSSPRSRGVGRAACAAGLLNVLVLSALGGRAHSPLMEGGVSAAFGSGVARMYDGVPWGGAGKGMRALVSPGGMLRLRGGVGKLAKRGKGEGEVGRKQAIGEGMKGKIERKEKSKSKVMKGSPSGKPIDPLSFAPNPKTENSCLGLPRPLNSKRNTLNADPRRS